MSQNPPRHLAWLDASQLHRRSRWDAEAAALMAAQAREAAPAYPPHGTPVGGMALWLWGESAEAQLLSTGRHCRSFGVRLLGPDGQPLAPLPEVMGIDRIFSRIISPAVRRPSSLSHYL